ncbi:AAA family ATPase [Streptomyces sp. NPDC058001]|uniref:AAA family ATPase n=1 Tax=Streptomyces sp. NPDC058001 TaxID=3346300 RepID=UPI0036E2597E
MESGRDGADGLPVVVVCGPPASGKSTVGEVAARALGAVLLDQDVVTGPLTAVVAELLGTDDLDSPALGGATRAARYETLHAAAEHNLRVGRPVVLVAPYTTERRDPLAWDRLAARLREAGGAPLMVWLRLRPEELLTRLRDRSAARDREKLAEGDSYLSRVDLTPPAAPHLAVDATSPPEAQSAKILKALVD